MAIRQIVGSAGLPMAALIFALLVMNPTMSLAACRPNPATPQKISDSLLNPTSPVNQPGKYRDDSSTISVVRDLVVSDPTTLAAVIDLLKSGMLNVQQQAVGTGLSLAANACFVPDSKFAAEIQTQLADTPSEEAKLQYTAMTGNKPIRGVAAGGLDGGSGGQTNPLGTLWGSSSTFQAFVANSVSNNPSNYSHQQRGSS